MTSGFSGKSRRAWPPPTRGELIEYEDIGNLIDSRYPG
jgi:hypothetical protein